VHESGGEHNGQPDQQQHDRAPERPDGEQAVVVEGVEHLEHGPGTGQEDGQHGEERAAANPLDEAVQHGVASVLASGTCGTRSRNCRIEFFNGCSRAERLLVVPPLGGMALARFALQAGERLVLVGALGEGKTTLLRAVAGVAPLARGRIEVVGVAVTHAPPNAGAPWAM
jgi:ABC-type uncharacterized transport system ATPase subunit